MANFCMKCGNPLDMRGLCPCCDVPVAPKFCAKCGTPIGADGSCSHCDAPVTELRTDLGATVPLSDIPQAEVAVQPPMPTPPTETKPPKKVSPLTVITTVLLSFCLFIATTLAVSILTVRRTVSEGGITELASQVDVTELLKTSGAANGETFSEFYYRLERDYGAVVDDYKLAEMLDDSTVPEYVSDKISDFAENFFSGKAELVITKDEIVDLLWNNRKLIEKEIPAGFAQTRLYKDDCEIIADWMFNGNELVIISTDQLQDAAPALYQSINIFFSYILMGFFLLLCAIIIFVMCRNSLSQTAIGVGTVLMLLGGITSLAAAVVAWIPGLWAVIAKNNLVLSLLGSVLAINAPLFVTLLAVGILLPILRAVIRRAAAKKHINEVHTQ